MSVVAVMTDADSVCQFRVVVLEKGRYQMRSKCVAD